MDNRVRIAAIIGIVALAAFFVMQQTQKKGEFAMDTSERLESALNQKEFKIFKEKGIRPIISRYGDVDIAFPADVEEYKMLGGYAVVMIVAISDEKNELPIEKAYFRLNEDKVMDLNLLGVDVDGKGPVADAVLKDKDSTGRQYFRNVSFWAVPVACFLVDDGAIVVDFKGDRKDFRILKGPWEIKARASAWVNKHTTNQIKVAEHVPYEVVARFIEREYFSNGRVPL